MGVVPLLPRRRFGFKGRVTRANPFEIDRTHLLPVTRSHLINDVAHPNLTDGSTNPGDRLKCPRPHSTTQRRRTPASRRDGATESQTSNDRSLSATQTPTGSRRNGFRSSTTP